MVAEIGGLLHEADDLLREGLSAFAALGPYLGQNDVYAELSALILHQLDLCGRICGELVDGDYAGKAVYVADIADVLEEVGKTPLKGFQVLRVQISLGYAAVVLKASDCRNDNDRVGLKACHAALDVEELLCSQVRAESGLSDCIISQLQGHLGCSDGVAAVRDVGEGAAMYDRGNVLKGLYEVGLEGVLEKGCHSALCVQVACCDGLLLADFAVCVADDDPGESLLEIVNVAGQAQNCHDLGSYSDVVAVLTGCAVDSSAQAVHYEAELAVIHIHASSPCDLAGIDIKLISLIDVVVDHSCQQVVRRADGVEVACEVQVNVLHGNDLRIAAACGAALDAEDRSEGGLAERHHDLLAKLLKAVSQTDGRCGLAFARRCGVHSCHKDQLAVSALGILEKLVVDLGLVFAVLFQIFVTDPCLCRDLCDRKHLTFLCDLDITLVSHSLFPFPLLCACTVLMLFAE